MTRSRRSTLLQLAEACERSDLFRTSGDQRILRTTKAVLAAELGISAQSLNDRLARLGDVVVSRSPLIVDVAVLAQRIEPGPRAVTPLPTATVQFLEEVGGYFQLDAAANGEILCRTADGQRATVREIASTIGRSPGTVHRHLSLVRGSARLREPDEPSRSVDAADAPDDLVVLQALILAKEAELEALRSALEARIEGTDGARSISVVATDCATDIRRSARSASLGFESEMKISQSQAQDESRASARSQSVAAIAWGDRDLSAATPPPGSVADLARKFVLPLSARFESETGEPLQLDASRLWSVVEAVVPGCCLERAIPLLAEDLTKNRARLNNPAGMVYRAIETGAIRYFPDHCVAAERLAVDVEARAIELHARASDEHVLISLIGRTFTPEWTTDQKHTALATLDRLAPGIASTFLGERGDDHPDLLEITHHSPTAAEAP